MTNEYIFTPIQCEWDITESERSEPIYNKIYSKKHKLKQLKYFLRYGEYVKKTKIIEPLIIEFLRNITEITYKTLRTETTKNNLLSYNFASSMAIFIHIILCDFDILPNDNFLILSKLNNVLDGLWFHLKFHKLYKPNIDQYLLYDKISFKEQQEKEMDKYANILKKINPQTTYFNNKWIDEQELPLYNMIFIDYWTWIDDNPHMYIRNSQLFDSYLPFIILSLTHLKIGGHMIIYTLYFSTRVILQLFHYIANYFELVKSININTELSGCSLLDTGYIIMKNYKGGVDMQKLRKLNERCFELDPTGGQLYKIVDKEIIKKFYINDNRTEHAKKYIISIYDDKYIHKYYKKYKHHMKQKIYTMIYVYMIYVNNNKKLYKENMNKAILFAQMYNLPIAEWTTYKKTDYANKYIKYIAKLDATVVMKLEPQIITEHIYVFKHNYEISEKSFMYMMKIDNKKYKEIELFINSKQKILQKLLKSEYNIAINNKPVNRAWKKIYELICDTKFLDNFNENITGFHICEAPGNFINAIHTYVTINKPNITYTWNAQSLSTDLDGFGDMYGFIKQTSDKWDSGNGSGDITNLYNKNYYYNKYKDCDILIGDCGVKWGDTYSGSLYTEQLYYAILFPKKGGNFIIKGNCIEISDEILYLLWTAYNCYSEIYICGSNTNFWSPEIYIVGKNKHNANNEYLQFFLEGKKILGSVPEEFSNEYIKSTRYFIERTTSIRRFFVFLVTYPKYFTKYKDSLSNILIEHNNKWIKQYMS